MDYPEAFGRMLGTVECVKLVRTTGNNDLLRRAVDALIEETDKIRAANDEHSRGIMEKLDAKIKELAK